MSNPFSFPMFDQAQAQQNLSNQYGGGVRLNPVPQNGPVAQPVMPNNPATLPATAPDFDGDSDDQ